MWTEREIKMAITRRHVPIFDHLHGHAGRCKKRPFDFFVDITSTFLSINLSTVPLALANMFMYATRPGSESKQLNSKRTCGARPLRVILKATYMRLNISQTNHKMLIFRGAHKESIRAPI